MTPTCISTSNCPKLFSQNHPIMPSFHFLVSSDSSFSKTYSKSLPLPFTVFSVSTLFSFLPSQEKVSFHLLPKDNNRSTQGAGPSTPPLPTLSLASLMPHQYFPPLRKVLESFTPKISNKSKNKTLKPTTCSLKLTFHFISSM